MKGYRGKLLRIDLSSRTWRSEPIDERRIRLYLGGRGIAARYYHDEIMPGVDPLSPGNKLFFFGGPLTGTPLPAAIKMQLATRSPETGRYLCSNSGGDFGTQLRNAGFDGLVVEGRAAGPTWVAIRDGAVTFHKAGPLTGMAPEPAARQMRAALGDAPCGAAVIGPAGEARVRISCINVDGRAFGRGGPGAVMGSKNLKGIAVSGTGEVAVADPARVAEIRRQVVADLQSSSADLTRYGTPVHVEPLNYLGGMPTRNFQTSYFEQADSIDAHAMLADYAKKSAGCRGCTVSCGKLCEVPAGPFAGSRARPEFETVGMFGPNCGISDFAAIVRAAELCDELGMDIISTANAVALVMELCERGLLSRGEVEGIDARFGSAEALPAIIRLVAERRGVGALLAEGMGAVKRARPEWNRFILEVKGMPFPSYDPRGFSGTALTTGTASRGACHNVGGWTIEEDLKASGQDRYSPTGKAGPARRSQDCRAYVDSLGICAVTRRAYGFTDEPSGDVLEAVTGVEVTPRLMEIGERIYNLERVIMNREGIRRRDDLMPERITREMLPSGPAKGKVVSAEMYAAMLDEYYAQRGWDADGVVTPDTARRLGLAELASAG